MKKSLGVLLSTWLITSWATAQKQPEFKDLLVTDKYLGWWGRTLADMNKDGLMDVVILKQSRGYGLVSPGWLGWLEAKDGGKRWEKKVIEENDLLGAGDMAVGDIDNDGDTDVLAFEGDETSKDTTARMYWWQNPSKTGAKWKRHYISTNPEFVKDVEIADFDKNGLLDIATVTYWHHQLDIDYQIAPNKWKKTTQLVLKGVHEGMHIGDIDGDKNIDIAMNGYWIKNPGKGKITGWVSNVINDKWFTQQYEGKLEWRHNGTKVFCRDINKDGKAEVFISHSEANVDGYPIAWYDRDPSTNTWTEHIIANDYHHCHTLQVYDMDNDGDLDVVSGEIPEHPTQKRVRIFLNKGNNLEWEEQVISNEGIYNGIVADFEGDGDYDIFSSPGYGNDYPNYIIRVNQTKSKIISKPKTKK
ncbi:MAG: FG-GAP repeat domain-containing protein [Leadbetterella sp.]